MKFFSTFSAFLLIVFCFNCSQAQEGAAWQVAKYDLSVTLPANAAERNLTAKAIISLKNVGRGAGASATFRINSKAEVTAAQIGDASASFRKTVADKLGDLQRFTVNLPSSVQPSGTTTITIAYRLLVPENNGLSAISAIGSQFLPLSVWYPTPNNPSSPRGADYAPFRLQVTAAGGETVISSGKANGNNFDQALNAQPFFVSGTWDLIEGANGISVYSPKGASVAARKRAEELIALTSDVRSFTANLLGNIPDVPWRLVAVQRGSGFSDGGTILLDYAAFNRQKIDESTAFAIAEAVVKTWLGNANALRGEGSGIIKEGLVRFVATQFIEKEFGRDAADIQRLRQRTSYVAVAKRDDEPPLALSSPSYQTYYASVPNKGAMIWRLVWRDMGDDKFFGVIRSQLQAGKGEEISLSQLREAFAAQGGDKVKAILAYGLDQVTDTDLLVGLPFTRGTEIVTALRNTGSFPVNLNVVAVTDKGERLSSVANIAGKNFGESVFKTTAKIVRVEIDPEKFYPQTDYSNDFAPREIIENDWSAAIASPFNRQDFAKAEATARKILAIQPHFDDARVWLGRALFEQNRLDEAEKEFQTSLAEKLPAAKTLAWANVGLGEIAVKRNQNAVAVKFFDQAVQADAEYASNLAARQERSRVDSAPHADESAKAFFASFDKTVLSARKAEVESYLMPGELASFANRLTANQPEQWQTKILRTELIDANRMAVEVNLTAKLLNKEASSGTALFILGKASGGWKLAGVDLFEVR